VGARQLSTLMPWSYSRNLIDGDLAAIFAYLRTLTPVKHRVDNTEPPTYCKVCRHEHGYGNMNQAFTRFPAKGEFNYGELL
jgi:hypothetical protein